MFALRPEIADRWDLRIWLDVDPDVARRRGIGRDAGREGGTEAAEALHRDRYGAAEAIYVREVDPGARADVVIANDEIGRPRLLRG